MLILSLDQDIQQYRWCLGYRSSINKSQDKTLNESSYLGCTQTWAEKWGNDLRKMCNWDCYHSGDKGYPINPIKNINEAELSLQRDKEVGVFHHQFPCHWLEAAVFFLPLLLPFPAPSPFLLLPLPLPLLVLILLVLVFLLLLFLPPLLLPRLFFLIFCFSLDQLSLWRMHLHIKHTPPPCPKSTSALFKY